MSVFMCLNTYNNNLSSKYDTLKQGALKSENIISEVINEHNWQIRSIADKIMKSDGNINSINQIISNHNKFDPKSNFDQFLNQKDLFWVDKNDNLVIKNKVGILQYPEKISKIYEVFNSKEEPWKLIISKDLPSFQKGYNLILTSFGVTDTNGKYLGSIISSIDINLIQNLLAKNLSLQNNDDILILSVNNKIVAQSNPKSILNNHNIFVNKLGNINYSSNQDGYIDEKLVENKTNYRYYKKISNYPLVILSGYNYEFYRSNLIQLLLKAIYPSVLVGIFLIVSLFLFYKRIVQPIKYLAEIAKKIGSKNEIFDGKILNTNSPEIFDLAKALLKIKQQKIRLQNSNTELTKTKHQLEEAIETIKKSDITQVEIIKQIKKDIAKNTAQVFAVLKMLKHNISNNSNHDTKMNLFLVQSLEQGIDNITKFATDELNKEYTDIRSVINKSVLSQEKEIKIRNINFDIIYSKNLPKKVFIDQVRLTQVLSAILGKTIALLSEENTFTITVKTVVKNKNKKLSIIIKDNGIGIGFKDHASDARRFGSKEESSINGIDISVDTIEDLVKLHQGDIVYKNQIQQGSSTTITIPCFKKINKIKESSIEYKGNNVIKFPIKNQNE